MTKKHLDNSKGVPLNMRTRTTITGLLLVGVAAALWNIQQSALAFAAEKTTIMCYMFGRKVKQQTYSNW